MYLWAVLQIFLHHKGMICCKNWGFLIFTQSSGRHLGHLNTLYFYCIWLFKNIASCLCLTGFLVLATFDFSLRSLEKVTHQRLWHQSPTVILMPRGLFNSHTSTGQVLHIKPLFANNTLIGISITSWRAYAYTNMRYWMQDIYWRSAPVKEKAREHDGAEAEFYLWSRFYKVLVNLQERLTGVFSVRVVLSGAEVTAWIPQPSHSSRVDWLPRKSHTSWEAALCWPHSCGRAAPPPFFF